MGLGLRLGVGGVGQAHLVGARVGARVRVRVRVRIRVRARVGARVEARGRRGRAGPPGWG